jgi:sugar phosphate isomerase/epimerase
MVARPEEQRMPRPVILCSGAWTDLPLEELAAKAGEWGYQGVELACWGDHCEVQRALNEEDYCQKKLDLLARHDLVVPVLNNQRVGQAICDPISKMHQPWLPEYVWGDGVVSGVQQRAAEEMVSTVRVAQKLGAAVLCCFTGSPLWPFVLSGLPLSAAQRQAGFQDFAQKWQPVLDACQEASLKLACVLRPGQLAFDLYSAEMLIDSVAGREELGFALDPAQLHWQGVDPVEVVRRFPDRIFLVHVTDAAISLNGRSGLLNSYWPSGDSRRGWDYRSPGHGGIDWEALIRTLNEVGYNGPLAVDWADPGMSREYGAEDACRFVQRLDFEPSTQG